MQFIRFIQSVFSFWWRKDYMAETMGLPSVHFIDYSFILVNRKMDGYRPSTIRNHLTALRSFAKFLPSGDIDIRRITPRLVADYTRWLARRGVGANTQSCYIRSLRSLYNLATARRRCKNARPFDLAFTGNAPTTKRAVGLPLIQRLQAMPLKGGSRLALSRDVFLFCVYAQGMPFADVARLTKANVGDGTLSYLRHKTGQAVTVALEPCMSDLLSKYVREDSPFLFPLLGDASERFNDDRAYRLALANHNRALHRISTQLGLATPLTSYVARHTWASLAFSNGMSINSISQAMGHTSTRPTQIYIKALDWDVIARANRKIITLLRKNMEQSK